MIAELWTIISQVITGFVSALVSATSGITELFYKEETFTVVGQLLLITVGMGIVYFVFRFILSLIRR